MPRKRRRVRRPRAAIPGLVRRGPRAYWRRRFPEAVGGDLIARALEAEWGSELATSRAVALNTLYDRGDWAALRRVGRGEVHVSEVQRAVREHDWTRLQRLNADGLLLGPAVDAFLRRSEATRSAGTRATHGAIAAKLLEHFGADYPMHALTTPEAEAFLHLPRRRRGEGEGVEPRPWSVGRQRNARVVAGAIWAYAAEREEEEATAKGLLATLRRNAWRKARVGEGWALRVPVVAADALRRVLAHPEVVGMPGELLVALGALAGLRISEMGYLRLPEDVDLDGPEPRVRVQARKAPHPWKPKTRRSERDVPLPPALVAILRRHVEAGTVGRYLVTYPGATYPAHRVTLHRWATDAFRAAGMATGRKAGGATAHALRHTYATTLLSEGVSVALVAEWMGDTPAVVLSTYWHWIKKDRDRGLAVLEALATGKE